MNIIHLPVVMVGISLLAAYLTPMVGLKRYQRSALLALIINIILFASALLVARYTMAGETIRYMVGGWVAPYGIEIIVDGPVTFMLVTITGISLICLWYAVREYHREAAGKTVRWYWTLTMLLLAAMMGLVMAGDLFNMFVFIEIASLAACAIIAAKGSGLAIDATLRYLVLSALGTGSLLFGIALTYQVTGHLNLAHIAAELPVAIELYAGNVYAGIAFITLGLAIKAGLFPVHIWLPDAHSSAPTPSSALLSGLVVKVFAFSFFRLCVLCFYPVLATVPIDMVIAILGGTATVAGSILASGQRNLKRLLAYSTVAQMGYVFLGFGLGGSDAVSGAMIYIMAHGMMKAGLFLAAGCILKSTGDMSIDSLRGIGRTMPLTAISFTVLALSMVGIPPTAGFAGKLYLATGALAQGQMLAAVVVVISTALTAMYFIPLVMRMYFAQHETSQAVSTHTQLPAAVFAGMGVALGFVPSLMLRLMGM